MSKPAEVVESLRENKDTLSLMDDFAKLTSESERRKQGKIIDMVVRMAHKGELGILGVTMESDARKYLAESCANRMLFVDIGKGVNDPEFSEMLYYLQQTHDLDLLILKFQKFIDNRSYLFMDELKQYRTQKNHERKSNQRLISMVFSYHFIMRLLNEYLIAEGFGSLDIQKILKIEEAFFNRKVTVGDDAKAELAELLLRRLLCSGEIVPQRCSVVEECSVHLYHGCKHRNGRCNQGFCDADMHHEAITSYSPNDLFLDYSTGTNSLLIEDPKMVPNFNRPFPVPSFLVMEADLLTERINVVLAKYCREQGRDYFYFTRATPHNC